MSRTVVMLSILGSWGLCSGSSGVTAVKDFSSLNKELCAEAREGSTDRIKTLLGLGANSNVSSEGYVAPLLEATEQGHSDFVRALLSHTECDLAVRTKDTHNTALHIAAQKGDAVLVGVLLGHGADRYLTNRDNNIPLHLAAQEGHLEVITLLSSEVEAQDDDSEPALDGTSLQGSLSYDKEQASGKVNIWVENNTGKSPIGLACQKEDLQVVRALLALKGSQCQSGLNALLIEVVQGNGSLNVVKILLMEGAEVTVCDASLCTPLHYAVMHSNLPLVKELALRGADINAQSIDSTTPLRLACQQRHAAMVQSLLRYVSLSACQDDLDILLFEMEASDEHLEIVQALLQAGANPLQGYKKGITFLCRAAEHGCLAVVKELLFNNAALSVSMGGMLPLSMACINGHEQVVQVLLDSAANLDRDDFVGCLNQIFIRMVKENRSLAIIKMLLDAGADVSFTLRNGTTAQHYAVESQSLEIVKELASRGANANALNAQNVTPLSLACNNGYVQIVTTLLRNINREECQDYLDILLVEMVKQNRCLEIIQALLQAGANPHGRSELGSSPLFFAVENKALATVKELLKYGAQALEDHGDGITPLYIACRLGHEPTVRALIESIENPDERAKKYLSGVFLKIVIKNGPLVIIKVLLDAGADVTLKDGEGNTALLYAAKNGALDVVNELLERKAQVNEVSAEGSTPLHKACRHGHKQIAEVLLAHGADTKVEDVYHKVPFDYWLLQGLMLFKKDDNGTFPLEGVITQGCFSEKKEASRSYGPALLFAAGTVVGACVLYAWITYSGDTDENT